MSDTTEPRLVDGLLSQLAQAIDLADALDTAARTGSEVEISRGDGTPPQRYGGQGALDRLAELRHDIGSVAAVAQAISLAAIADRLEHIGTVLEDRFARTDATAGEPPPPVTVSGCCRVPLGEPHAADCRWADGRHRP